MPERDYSTVPLAKKLGLLTTKPESREIVLIGAPSGFRETLGDLPELAYRTCLSPRTALALCFVRSLQDLDSVIDMLVSSLPREASAWIIRRKTHHKPGFNENHVRDAALPHGLVDYKICSLDEDWSGIKFAWRKELR